MSRAIKTPQPKVSALNPSAKKTAQAELKTEGGNTGLNISYEFFPPKTPKAEDRLWNCIQKLEPLGPNFVSVTYGAGGSTREPTRHMVTRIAAESSLRPAAHLTCVEASRADIDAIAREYWQSGISHIVALRGDPPSGIEHAYQPFSGGYAYGSDLVAGLKRIADFEISVSAYPERHPESPNWDAEIDNLKRKIDAGASRAITQFFFDAATFLRFRDRLSRAGVHIPLVPGIMLQPNIAGLTRMSDMCGIDMPGWYAAQFEGITGNKESCELLTTSLMFDLTARLHEHGVRDFHLYTLNKADMAYNISRHLKLRSTAAAFKS